MKRILLVAVFPILMIVILISCDTSKTNSSENTESSNEEVKLNIENGHEYVDLGLSVKWATYNVGAESPEDYGDYFAWAESEPKECYNWKTYIYCKGDGYSITKYCADSDYGVVDNKTILDLEHDAAHVNWGGKWRMPTEAELQELIDNCIWEWSTQNGVNGYMVISKKNDNSIFLPAAGHYDYSTLFYAHNYGYYWSSSSLTGYSHHAYGLVFNSNDVDWGNGNRYRGLSLRPVCE